MKKKLLMMMLCVCMAFSVTACGDRDEDDYEDRVERERDREEESNTDKKNEKNEKWRNQVVSSGNLIMNLKGEKKELDFEIRKSWNVPYFDGLFCIGNDGKLYVIESDLEPKCIAEDINIINRDTYPVVFSNGGVIAYYNHKNLYVYDAEKKEIVQEFENVEPNFALASNGKAVAYWNGNNICISNLDGSVNILENCTEPERVLSVSNDGKTVFYMTKPVDSYYGNAIMSYVVGEGEKVITGERVSEFRDMSVSGDGTQIQYVVEKQYYIASADRVLCIIDNDRFDECGVRTYPNSLYGYAIDSLTFDHMVYRTMFGAGDELPMYVICDSNKGIVKEISGFCKDVFVDENQNNMIFLQDYKLQKTTIDKTGIVTESLLDGESVSYMYASADLNHIYATTRNKKLYHINGTGEVTLLMDNKNGGGTLTECYDEHNNRLFFIAEGYLYSISDHKDSLKEITEINGKAKYLSKTRGAIFCVTEDNKLYYIDGNDALLIEENYEY